LTALEERLRRRGHAVIVVAEGAGQQFFNQPVMYDASGNKNLGILVSTCGTKFSVTLQQRISKSI